MNTKFASRKYVVIAIFFTIGIIFIIRLFLLQIIDNDYKLSADNNVLRYITDYPARGLIYDRNQDLLVYNEATYDLNVIPRQIMNLDTVLLCKLLTLTTEEFNQRLQKAKKYSSYKPSVLLEQISKEDYGYLEEQLYKFPGFFVQARTLRKYPYPNAAHVLGYVGEVNSKEVQSDAYYKSGDYIGRSGIEKYYEDDLRGQKGLQIKMVDVFNREKGSFQNGKYDSTAISGTNLYLSIDAQLQAYGERLMQNKKGSIVAIEPSTGEIIAMVSAPAYDPNLLIGRIRNVNFSKLSQDTTEPLFNRATMAQYPPGSTFKPVDAVIGLNENVLHSYTKYSCQGTVSVPIVCSHDHYSPLDLNHAIEQSCNPYFWKVFKSILEQDKFADFHEAYDHWRHEVMQFGIGTRLNSDVNSQRKGNLPEHTYFDRYYGKNGWKAITVRSMSVGQGEIELTPLQLANQAVVLANRGYYFSPHLVKGIGVIDQKKAEFQDTIKTDFQKKHFEQVIEGMSLVYHGEKGSVSWFKVDSLQLCGKTGTAQNPHGEAHSVFIAFAPKDNPKIAISVVVENCGFGATWAAPIASLMIEKYLRGEVKHSWIEDKMLNTNLISKQ